MNFWNQLRWIGSALFIAMALLLAVLAWQERQDTPNSSPPPAASSLPPAGNSHGL
jgi:hypothetical protein